MVSCHSYHIVIPKNIEVNLRFLLLAQHKNNHQTVDANLFDNLKYFLCPSIAYIPAQLT